MNVDLSRDMLRRGTPLQQKRGFVEDGAQRTEWETRRY